MSFRNMLRPKSHWKPCGLTSVNYYYYYYHPLHPRDLISATDYMDRRRIFTVDPNYFPLARMREIVAHLHSHDQQYGGFFTTIIRVARYPNYSCRSFDDGSCRGISSWRRVPSI